MQSERRKACFHSRAARLVRPCRRAGRPRPCRTLLALLLIAMPFGLAACVPAPTLARHTVTLPAADIVTRYHYDDYFYDSGLCEFGAERVLSAPPGALLVGADNYFKDTNEPVFPCIRKDDYAYRGGVRFNLSPYRALTQVVVEKAIISWAIDHALVRDGNGNPSGVPNGPDATNCVGALMEGKQSPYTQGAFLPAIPYLKGKGDVTSIVQSWVMNGDPNWGFVLVGLNESYSRNNAACVNTISHITLTMTYLAAS